MIIIISRKRKVTPHLTKQKLTKCVVFVCIWFLQNISEKQRKWASLNAKIFGWNRPHEVKRQNSNVGQLSNIYTEVFQHTIEFEQINCQRSPSPNFNPTSCGIRKLWSSVCVWDFFSNLVEMNRMLFVVLKALKEHIWKKAICVPLTLNNPLTLLWKVFIWTTFLFEIEVCRSHRATATLVVDL